MSAAMRRFDNSRRIEEMVVDQQVERDLGRPSNRAMGWAALLGSVAVASVVPGTLASLLLGLIPISGTSSLGFIIGAIGGQYYFAKLVPKYFVRTSQVMKFVATSPYTGLGFVSNKKSSSIVFPEGTLTPCVPGLGREARGNVPMELITLPIAFSVPGKDAEIFVNAVYQYRVDPDQAAGYVGFSDETILAGITPMIRGKIASEIEGKTLDEAKAARTKINTKLTNYFGGKKVKEVTAFEETYCVISEHVVIEQFTVSKTVQESRDAVAQSEQMMTAAAKMLSLSPDELKQAIKDKTVSIEQLERFYNLALVQSGKVKKDIRDIRYDGLDGVAKVAGEAVMNAILAFRSKSS
jgi:hypothetical protein